MTSRLAGRLSRLEHAAAPSIRNLSDAELDHRIEALLCQFGDEAFVHEIMTLPQAASALAADLRASLVEEGRNA